MRLRPRDWNLETLWCATNGHVAPAATVGTMTDDDDALALPTPEGTRLCRCLRCDAWVNFAIPRPSEVTSERLPPPSELPQPQRGKALDETFVIRIIAVERGLHALAFLILAALLVAVRIGLPWIQQNARTMLEGWQSVVDDTRPASPLLNRLMADLANLDGGQISVLLLVALLYVAIGVTEAIFLWRGKRWAEYLTVIATALPLPFAVAALAERVTIPRILAVSIDVAILAYLIWAKRLFGVRGGQRSLDAELAADVDWRQLHTTAPVTRP